MGKKRAVSYQTEGEIAIASLALQIAFLFFNHITSLNHMYYPSCDRPTMPCHQHI